MAHPLSYNSLLLVAAAGVTPLAQEACAEVRGSNPADALWWGQAVY